MTLKEQVGSKEWDERKDQQEPNTHASMVMSHTALCANPNNLCKDCRDASVHKITDCTGLRTCI